MPRTRSGIVLVDGDADDRAEAPPAHELLDRLEQVVGLELLDGQLGVARDAEGVRLERPPCPGRASSRLAAMTCSSQVNHCCSTPSVARLGAAPARATGTSRGSESGTLTRANRSSPLGVAEQHGEVVAHVGDVRERAGPGRTPAA